MVKLNVPRSSGALGGDRTGLRTYPPSANDNPRRIGEGNDWRRLLGQRRAVIRCSIGSLGLGNCRRGIRDDRCGGDVCSRERHCQSCTKRCQSPRGVHATRTAE